MQAAFALLANTEVHNFIRGLAWAIHQKYHVGLEASRLPPHVSLKQPFAISDLAALETYMREFAGSLPAVEVRLGQLQLVPAASEGLDTGILWFDVQETERLRLLHNRLCNELAMRFGDTQAPFDGKDYHFHLTIALGAQPYSVYQAMYDEISSTPAPAPYLAQELALFVYDESERNPSYMTYKILPLKGKDDGAAADDA
jgi:2'-5' RNA ligase